jgi:hypothetical protein
VRKWKRLILIAVVAMGSLIAVTLSFRWSNPIRITKEQSARIQPGMKRQEVETILGAPAGDYHTENDIILISGNNNSRPESSRVDDWWGNEGVITVGFNRDDVVVWINFNPATRLRTPVERWLGRSPVSK